MHLKLIYVVIDGLGDVPIKELGNDTPLGFAETPYMDELAKEGKTGLMYTVGKGVAPESDVAVISILGYDPFKYSTGRGVLEAVGAGIPMKNGDLAVRCNFATLGSANRILDRRAGRNLTTEEANSLSQSVNEKVKLETHSFEFDFRNTIGHRGVLVIKSQDTPLSGNITNTDPAYVRVEGLGVAETRVEMMPKRCEPMDSSEEAKRSAELVNEFVEKSHQILENDPVNKKRIAEGKLKANLILTRDAGHLLPNFFSINDKYSVSFACLADMPVERGISKLAGMSLVDLPPPSGNLKQDCLLRVDKLLAVFNSYDCFYVHIKGPDEPAHDGEFQLKTDMIVTVDQYFFGKLLPKTDLTNCVVCVTADHSTPCMLKAHSDDPVPLLISGNAIEGDQVEKFSEKACRRGSLGVMQHGWELMPQLMGFAKRKD